MSVKAINEKSKVSLLLQKKKLLSLLSSRVIESHNLPVVSLDGMTAESEATREKLELKPLKAGWRVSASGKKGFRNWWIKCKPQAIIFPTREGEYISNPKKLAKYQTYSLSYPGTASTKCIIVFLDNGSGVLIGSKPSLVWAKLSLTRNGEKKFIIKFLQNKRHLYLFPFQEKWETAVDQFKSLFPPDSNSSDSHRILTTPRYFLQMGIRDFFGRAYIRKFSDLLPYAKRFRETMGEGHFIHLFGTNASGFDRMLPNFSIDKKLGGKLALSKLLRDFHALGFYTSHHFNPRIADIHWLKKHPRYKEAVVVNPGGNPWIEFYKNNVYFVMNANNESWQEYCLKTIRYFKSIGFDYVELDQIAYQRNLYTPEGGSGPGYQELIDKTAKVGIKFWLEGVSDIYKLPPNCYFQVLPRDRAEFWETGENRRGYPYGTAFTRFYRRLMPKAPISFQLITEKCKVNLMSKRFTIAKKLNAQILDLELGFVDKTYNDRFEKMLKALQKLHNAK